MYHIYVKGITGYIKTNFAVVINQQKTSSNECYGAIAENKVKLVVRNFKFEDNFLSPFEDGEHVEILGILQREGK